MNQNNEDNKGVDLSGALDDSSSGVKFESDQQASRSYYPSTPKVIQWVIKYSGGLVKDEERAIYAILGFVALAILVSLFLVFGGSEEKLTSEEQLFLNTPPSQFNP